MASRSLCDETPALALVVGTVGLSLAGCVLSLVVACRARTFGLRLTACFALSVLIGLPVWLLPSEWCTSQSLLEEFSYLSSMLWAVLCMFHIYLVVNTGLRVAWRFEVFAHAIGWGIPLLSTAWLWTTGTIGMGELGICWIGEQHVAARVLFFFAPLGVCVGAMLVLLGLVSFQAAHHTTHTPLHTPLYTHPSAQHTRTHTRTHTAPSSRHPRDRCTSARRLLLCTSRGR